MTKNLNGKNQGMNLIDKLVKDITAIIKKNSLPDNGFAIHKNGSYRPDATAWAVIALSNANINDVSINLAREKLKQTQMSDGRVTLKIDQPRTWWPTPLAVMAWHKEKKFRDNQNRAVDFMLDFSGRHWKKNNSITRHDPAIKGWPWIENTHSWVEPTSMAVIALEIAGKGNHPRVEEAKKMLLDRQLDFGGWNYGNTTVFGRQLRPMPESTGIALCALYKKVDKNAIKKSLEYLQNKIQELKTPFSLGWGLLGLGAWGIVPDDKSGLIDRCLKQQEIFGTYNTLQLSLLLIALSADNGLVDLIK
ncbi:MAG: prenyltransferase/squalene oxidase repeat-containing protein [Bacteroidota bacterium]